MALTQLQAITRRKLRPDNVSAINAMTPYLPRLYQLKSDEAYRDKAYQLERDTLKENEKFAKKSLGEQKEQAQKANRIALLNLGTTTGLGMYREGMFGGDNASPAGGLTAGAELGIGEPTTTGALQGGITGVGTRFGEAPTWGAGFLGATAGKLLGGEDKTKNVLLGGAAGALASWAAGGDLYSTIASGILGGIGGGIF